MDLVIFSAGMAVGFGIGALFGVYYMVHRLKKAFENLGGATGMLDYFKDSLVENDPSLDEEEDKNETNS